MWCVEVVVDVEVLCDDLYWYCDYDIDDEVDDEFGDYVFFCLCSGIVLWMVLCVCVVGMMGFGVDVMLVLMVVGVVCCGMFIVLSVIRVLIVLIVVFILFVLGNVVLGLVGVVDVCVVFVGCGVVNRLL